jgi:ubiquinone/menaquinone biosynthesis C-methylase UbiE
MTKEEDPVRAEWQAVAGGWRRWEPLFQSFTWPLALRMTTAAQIGDGQRILDVGCGIGDPTLQVAVLVGPHGRVVGVDLAEGMLATARERAAALGLGHVEFRAGDVASMELPPHAFDAVLGRWSLIYVRDVAVVLARLAEALVPSGRIAIAAWAPPRRTRGSRSRWPRSARRCPCRRPIRRRPASSTFRTTARSRRRSCARASATSARSGCSSQFARDAREFWAMLTDMAGPLAP